MMLVMVLLAATADLSRAEEATGASESPPSPPPAKDWSKTASGHGGVKLNPASAWTQYVMAGDVFYIRDDDWSSRIDTPVRSLAARRASSACAAAPAGSVAVPDGCTANMCVLRATPAAGGCERKGSGAGQIAQKLAR
jgi:hypothetical protein